MQNLVGAYCTRGCLAIAAAAIASATSRSPVDGDYRGGAGISGGLRELATVPAREDRNGDCFPTADVCA